MNAEWRNYAKPEEIAEHDGLIAVDRANAARRRLIRNRCNMRKKQAQIIATLRADLAKAVEGLEGALGGLGCRSDCEWLHPDGSKCDCGNRERKLIAQSLIKELRP